MDYRIEHELPGRLRLRLSTETLTPQLAPVLAALMKTQDGVKHICVSGRTGSVLLYHDGLHRDELLCAFELITPEELEDLGLEIAAADPPLSLQITQLLSSAFARRLLPMTLRIAVTALRAWPYFRQGWRALWKGQLNVSVLDAAAVGTSLLRGDVATAGTIMTLLALGDLIEDWTKKRSRASLADSLAVQLDSVWVLDDQGTEIELPLSSLNLGDQVIVRAGGLIPVDGTVISGEAMVNQASMTGEPLSVRRGPGNSVYAGTAIEAGELVVRVTALADDTRLSHIAQLIAESEELKANVQCRAERLADGLVPWSFALAGLIFVATGDLIRASTALMVDYSCAIKLATPLTILSAMREGARRGVVIKGGKYLEALSRADTVVFDKTGTLTVSLPKVVDVIPFSGWKRADVLRLAACLEEHFPHSVATAVVHQAKVEGLKHEEEHAEVEYVVAHGVVSHLSGKQVLIGSQHFVVEDSGVLPTPEQQAIIDEKGELGSLLFISHGDSLIGLLVIDDPLRDESPQVIHQLRQSGIEEIIMLTGDHPKTAARVAKRVGVDQFKAEMLPEEKTGFVKKLRLKDRQVIMVGDGINDSPALASAHCGVSFRSGADVAQQVADVVLTHDLTGLIHARALGRRAMARIETNYGIIVGLNTLFLGLGLAGIITPAMSALAHNLVTVATSFSSLRDLLPTGTAPDSPSEKPALSAGA